MEYAINVYVCTQIAVNAFCKKFPRIPGRNPTKSGDDADDVDRDEGCPRELCDAAA